MVHRHGHRTLPPVRALLQWGDNYLMALNAAFAPPPPIPVVAPQQQPHLTCGGALLFLFVMVMVTAVIPLVFVYGEERIHMMGRLIKLAIADVFYASVQVMIAIGRGDWHSPRHSPPHTSFLLIINDCIGDALVADVYAMNRLVVVAHIPRPRTECENQLKRYMLVTRLDEQQLRRQLTDVIRVKSGLDDEPEYNLVENFLLK
jgi:hypothetical protein